MTSYPQPTAYQGAYPGAIPQQVANEQPMPIAPTAAMYPQPIMMPQAMAVPQSMALQPGMVAVPGFAMQMPAGYPLEPMEALQQIRAAWISQKVQIAEAFTPCEFENRYRVYNTEKKGGEVKKDKQSKIFKCKERSTCCQRQCIPAPLREFKMDIMYRQYEFDPAKGRIVPKWVPFLEVKRDYACTCCCLNRPIIRVDCVYKGQNSTIGYVKNVWKCCDNELVIYTDHESNADLKVTSTCCKCGFCCQCPCDSCREVALDIIDLKAGDTRVGEIRKQWAGCAKECFTNADEYAVQFPVKHAWQQKALLLAATVFIDYLYFEERHDGNNNN